jgi:hypothetical protein
MAMPGGEVSIAWKRTGTSAADRARCGLVHHEHAHVVNERPGNLNDLLLTERQRPVGFRD